MNSLTLFCGAFMLLVTHIIGAPQTNQPLFSAMMILIVMGIASRKKK